MIRTLSLLLLASAALLPAQDDRDRSTKTGAIWQTNVTPAEMQTLINQGWRFTDLEIESSSTWEFTVSAVQNTGTYQKSWWWVYGVTTAQLNTTISQNNARIVDIETYDDAGITRYAAILISNTGADQKAWWWYPGQTSAQVNSNLTANNGRLTSFDRYTQGGVDRYTTVMISNTGADQRNWGYLYGASVAAISSNVNQNGNRIYSIERVANDSYDVILVQNSNFGWWWDVDMTEAEVTELLEQNIGRLVDVERNLTLSGTRYTAIVLDNANSLERTARQQFFNAPAASLGDYGFFLKEVNGPVLAEMRADTVFEPASTMKTLYHVHAMRRVSQLLTPLTQQINKPLVCGTPGQNQPLEQLLGDMMEYSDNMSTLAVSNYFGIGSIDTTASVLGMTSTNINYTLGCTGPTPGSIYNQMTLRDLSELHEDVANGYLGSQRAKFYDLMANGEPDGLSFPTWGTTTLSQRINAEAITLGMPSFVRDAFKAALQVAYKPGGIGLLVGGTNYYWHAEGGWMRVPFKDATGNLVPREYTFGVFNHEFHALESAGEDAMGDAELELVWNRVRAAMLTWDNHVGGQITQLLGAGCAGPGGLPSHTASGTPESGATVNYSVGNTPPFALAIAAFGFDNNSWNGIPLPLNLAVIGAPGCILRINAVVLEAGVTSFAGARSQPVSFPYDPALIGAQLYSQYLVSDPAANQFGFTITSAIRTTLGGWL